MKSAKGTLTAVHWPYFFGSEARYEKAICWLFVYRFSRHSRPFRFAGTTVTSPALILNSVGFVLTDAKPPLFSSKSVPENSRLSSSMTLKRPFERRQPILRSPSQLTCPP